MLRRYSSPKHRISRLCAGALLTGFGMLLPGLPAFAQQEARPAVSAPSLSPNRIAAVDAAVHAEMDKEKAVGVAIGIIEDGKIVYLKGYGWADREAQLPVTEQTLFRWASISKSLTAVAAVQLVQQGKLDLDADVRKYVPEFPDKGTVITSRQVLGHQGGIVHYTNGKVIKTQATYTTAHPFTDVVTALDTFKESPLLSPPGEKYSYSTYGFMLMSAVVQRAGSERFADQVQKRIADPLGMTTLKPDYQWEALPGRAVGYRTVGDKVVRSSDTDVSWKLGGGGYISTVGDLARFAEGLLNHRLVNRESERLMWQAQNTKDGKPTTYGLGFAVEIQNGTPKISHNGSQEKSRTRMVLYPYQRRAVVVMSNSEYADPGKFSTAIFAALNSAKP
jgi:serine beta-lactamase-like protein LACTB